MPVVKMAYSQIQVIAGGFAHIPVLIGLFKVFDSQGGKNYQLRKAAEAKAKAAAEAKAKAAAEAKAKAAAEAKANAEVQKEIMATTEDKPTSNQ